FLPNKYRMSMKNCFILAEGYGNLSSERVMLRTNTLSCVEGNGNYHIAAAVHGYVVGHHGKVGLRGKVVTKQGAILARVLLAGFLQGVANVANQSSMTYQYSGLGSVGTMNPSDIGIGAAASGFGMAAQSLSKFYLKLANSMFPVVVVGAGRRLTIVITKGTYVNFKRNMSYSRGGAKKK
ncbi:MAG: TraB/VirB10 family protein, partial [Patescibacteria group bacterium]